MPRRIATLLTLSLFLALSFGALAQHAPADKSAVSAQAVWDDLVSGNQRFMSGHAAAHDFTNLRRELAKGQAPHAIVLGCSDSRVPPELLFDKNLGDLFVVRSAGNIADKIGVGSIEYAVEHLGSTLLVVLGHESCGAVLASCAGKPLPSPNLVAIGEAITPACKNNGNATEATHYSVVANVNKSAADLLARSEVLREAVQAGKIEIVKAVYRLDTGEVVRLP